MNKTSPRIVALVPMRHESERVPGKNYREIAGRPLFHYILHALEECEEIAQIVVDTDSEPIKNGVGKHFPAVTILDRPEKLRAGETPMNDILLYDSSQVEADYYIQTHSTNPLLRPESIKKALKQFLQAWPENDSLFSVSAIHTRLYDQNGAAINHNPGELLRTQDLPPIFEENSCLYIFARETLEKYGHRMGERPIMFTIPAEEAWDIDEEIDFQIADFLLRQREEHE